MTDAQPVKLSWTSAYAAPTVDLPESGQRIAGAARVTVDCVKGEPPKIFVEFTGDTDVEEFEGVVHVVREIPADPLKAVQDFLDNISGEALTSAILNDEDLASKQFGDAALEVMKRWARGD